MMAPARSAAYQALQAIDAERADLPSALARSRQHLEDERDRALCAEIVIGTLRWRRALDYLVAHLSSRPFAQIDSDVLTILRLSLYQLLHLDRVPAAAVVDDAVTLTRAARKPSASGFVNAVLRSALRRRRQLPLPARPDQGGDRAATVAYLGTTHSHPDWLVARWLDRYGFEAAEHWVQFNNETAALTLRANRLRTTREGLAAALAADEVDTEPTRFAPDGLVVTRGHPLRAPLDGSFVVQDEASQLVARAVAAQAGDRVLDLCASPGGKTTALAGEMQDRGRVIACDVRARRVRLLRDTVRLSGARCVRVLQVDTKGSLPFGSVFDRVLVDAPCSGLGTIRRDPDIRWRRHESDLAALAAGQVRLLARAAQTLAPAGRLVYATCSSEPEENEGVIDTFLADHPEFRPIDLRSEERPVVPLALLDGRGMLRTLPFRDRLEAFFAAALTRR